GRHAGGGFARRLSAAAAIIADAVFGEIGVVGMAGTEFVADLVVVARALIDVFDQEPDRRAGGELLLHPLVLKDAGENLHLIGFAPLAGEARLSRTPAVEIALNVGFGERNAGRAAINDTADRRPVAFAEGRDPEHVAEGVERHWSSVPEQSFVAAGK